MEICVYFFKAKIITKSYCIVVRLELETVFSHAWGFLQSRLFHDFSSYLPLVEMQTLSDRTELMISLCLWAVPCKMSWLAIFPVSWTLSFFLFGGDIEVALLEGLCMGSAIYNLWLQLRKLSMVWGQSVERTLNFFFSYWPPLAFLLKFWGSFFIYKMEIIPIPSSVQIF